MRLGILFSGQGAQKPGMGIDLLADPLFEKVVSAASAITGQDLPTILKSEHDELATTINVQPALVTVSVGLFKMLQRDLPDLPITAMAGLSLGEYAALIASEAVSFDSGMALLADRAKYMQADADATPSTMAAIVKPDVAAIEQLCSAAQANGHGVYVANYNSPSQIVLGGKLADLQLVVDQISAQGLAKKAVILKVNGAFHTPLFDTAKAKLTERVQTVTFTEPKYPMISNTTSQALKQAEIASVMARQLAVPTHFGDDLAVMVNDYGVDTILEIGPGKTLSQFAKQVDRSLTRYQMEDLASYQAFVKEIQDGTQG
ncbi:ACP S-malonyltransferase [Limosilactobacillus equigenerosi]|nr:ACP S-malonyltransferase [Limosilactobacillus equigenerosi]